MHGPSKLSPFVPAAGLKGVLGRFPVTHATGNSCFARWAKISGGSLTTPAVRVSPAGQRSSNSTPAVWALGAFNETMTNG